jgi:hypothetical protein
MKQVFAKFETRIRKVVLRDCFRQTITVNLVIYRIVIRIWVRQTVMFMNGFNQLLL